MEQADVLVIGAGISGLCGAKLLYEEGLSVIVLEARDRVGGRTLTFREPTFDYVDVGGAYVGPTQDRIVRLAKELKVKLARVDDKGKTVLNAKNYWSSFTGNIPEVWNPLLLLDLNNVIRTTNAMAKQVPTEAPWNAPKAIEWDAMTVAEYANKLCWTKFTRDLLSTFLACILASELHEVSLLYFLWYVHSGGGLQRLSNIDNAAQERKFVGGSQQISEKMHQLLGDRVRLSSPVVTIDQNGDGVVVTVESGKQYKAKHAVSAVPVSLLNKISFRPSLPPEKIQLIQRMPMGCVIKTISYYDEEYWKNDDFSGTMMSLDDGLVGFSMNDTKPDGSHPALMGFIMADKAKSFMSVSKHERKRLVAEHYAKVFKCEKLRHPINYVEKNWMEEEYSGGCYVGVMPPGVLTSFGPILREPVGNVHFAGTETASAWMGYMDGAVQAGERAAREVLHKLGRISLEEVWQEEKPSLDVPAYPISEMVIEKFLPSVEGQIKCMTVLFGGLFLYVFFKYFDFSVQFKGF